jgi:hypothetical protein
VGEIRKGGIFCRLEVHIALASALRMYQVAILKEGKEVVTGTALKHALLTTIILLKTATQACETLVLRLTPRRRASEGGRMRAASKLKSSNIRKV